MSGQQPSKHSTPGQVGEDYLLSSLLHLQHLSSSQTDPSVGAESGIQRSQGEQISSGSSSRNDNSSIPVLLQDWQVNIIIAEYTKLRDEITQNDSLSLQVMTFIVFLTTAIMGFAFSQQVMSDIMRSILFLSSILISLVGMVQNYGRMRNTYITGSYIKIFIESNVKHLQWETRLYKFRSQPKTHGGMNLIIHQRLVFMVVIFANLALGVYYLLVTFRDDIIVAILILSVVVPAILIPYTLSWRAYTKLGREHTKEFDKIWEDIRDKEQTEVAPGKSK